MGKEQEIARIAQEILAGQPEVGDRAPQLARAAYNIAEKYCGRIFVAEETDFTEIVTPRRGMFFLKAIPIRSITSIVTLETDEPLTARKIISDIGLVVLAERYDEEIVVRYKGGLDTLPEELLLAIRDIGINLWLLDPHLVSMRGGDFSFDVDIIPPKISKVLDLYTL